MRPVGGAWQPAVDLSAAGQDAVGPAVAVDAQGDAVAVWQRSNGTISVVQGAVRPAGGAWQPAVDLSAVGQDAVAPHLAVDPQGDAVAVWQHSSATHIVVQGAVRPASSAVWQPATRLSAAGQDADGPAVAVDAQGDAVAVWGQFDGGSNSNIAEGAVRPASTGVWGSAIALSAAGQNAELPAVAVDAQGDAVAVWERSNGTDTIVQGAVNPAVSGVWQPPVNLSAAGQNADSPQVAVDAQGDALAVWDRSNGTNQIVQGAAGRAASGAWQPAANLSVAGQNGLQAQVAIDPQGDAVAVWHRSNGTKQIVQAAVRPASGGLWQAPVDLSAVGRDALDPQVAVDPQGEAVAVWDRSNGADTIVQGAGYDALGPALGGLSIPATGTVGQPLSFAVSPLDAWSALGATSWSFGDGAGAQGTSVTHTYAAAGSYPVTVTGTDALANATGASGTVVIAPAPAPAPPPAPAPAPAPAPVPAPGPAPMPVSTAPRISNVTQSHSRWREGTLKAKFARTRRPSLGTTFSFSLDQRARVSFAFTTQVAGRDVKHKCVTQTRKNRRSPACLRTVTRGTLSFSGRSARNTVTFQGRLTTSKRLPLGRYKLLITATNAAGQHSQTRSLSFTIAK